MQRAAIRACQRITTKVEREILIYCNCGGNDFIVQQLHGVAILRRFDGGGEGLILAVADLRAIGLARVFADRPDVVKLPRPYTPQRGRWRGYGCYRRSRGFPL